MRSKLASAFACIMGVYLSIGDAAATETLTCLHAPAKLEQSAIQNFLDNPEQLLKSNAAADAALSNDVRSLVGSSETTLDAILGLSAKASPAQRVAIATGLARIVEVCSSTNPDFGALIQQKVASLNDGSMIAAFAQASNDVRVAAIAASASSAGSGATTDGTSQISGQNTTKYSDGPTDTTSGQYTIGNAANVASNGNVSGE